MTSIAIIPARGGSKRIPRKNIKSFLGRPIITYSIECAIKSNLFDVVMVSTDDKEIAQISKESGANVPFLRSTENSNDYVGTAEVLLEVLEKYKSEGSFFEYCCCIYPTAPFVKSEAIIEGFNMMAQNNYDAIFPIVKYSYPIQRSVEISDEGYTKMLWPENYNKRSQDLPPIYHDAGQFYWLKSDSLFREQTLWPEKTGSIIVSEKSAQDIDNLTDWEIAELKYKLI